MVLGVSPDTVPEQSAFAAKHGLPFALLADPGRTAIDAYGVWGKLNFKGREFDGVVRSTFLVDPEGRLVREWRGVKVDGHVDEVLRNLP